MQYAYTICLSKSCYYTCNSFSVLHLKPPADLFVGQLKSSLTCSHCGFCSTVFDPFWDLSLPIAKVRKHWFVCTHTHTNFTEIPVAEMQRVVNVFLLRLLTSSFHSPLLSLLVLCFVCVSACVSRAGACQRKNASVFVLRRATAR